jgi:hypothetical protein
VGHAGRPAQALDDRESELGSDGQPEVEHPLSVRAPDGRGFAAGRSRSAGTTIVWPDGLPAILEPEVGAPTFGAEAVAAMIEASLCGLRG